MARLIRIDGTGHTTLAEWSVDDPASRKAAVAAFRTELDRGMLAAVSAGRRDRGAGSRAAAGRGSGRAATADRGRVGPDAGRRGPDRSPGGRRSRGGARSRRGASRGCLGPVAAAVRSAEAAPRRATVDGVDGLRVRSVRRRRRRRRLARAVDASGRGLELCARVGDPDALRAAGRALGRADRVGALGRRGPRETRTPSGSRWGCSPTWWAIGSGSSSRGPAWRWSGAGSESGCSGSSGALLVRPGGRRVNSWCVRIADPEGLPAGDRIAHLLLALREDERGFCTVANMDFSGAARRVRRHLPRAGSAGPGRSSGSGRGFPGSLSG